MEQNNETDIAQAQQNSVINGLIQAINYNMQLLAAQQNENHRMIIESITRPKQVIRDASGKVQGVV